MYIMCLLGAIYLLSMQLHKKNTKNKKHSQKHINLCVRASVYIDIYLYQYFNVKRC